MHRELLLTLRGSPNVEYVESVWNGKVIEDRGPVRRGSVELLHGAPRIGDMGASLNKRAEFLVALWVAAAVHAAGLAQSRAVPGSVAAPVAGADGKPQVFAVASVRRNVTGTETCDPEHLYVTADGFHMANCPLIVALFMAYVPADSAFMGFSTEGRVAGAPDWMKSEPYDIEARLDEADRAAWQDPAKQKEMMHAMLQSLLQERCGLVVHREMPEKPAYALLVAKGGPKFHEAKSVDSAAIIKEHPNVGAVPGGGGMFSMGANGSIDFYATPISSLAVVLSNKAGRVVVDKTGLTGRYDIKLEMQQPGPTGTDGMLNPGISIFTVVREQLGLRMESTKEPVETLVIDHVERPTEN
jgi:uncharacterized protein (TIGR03435 family)